MGVAQESIGYCDGCGILDHHLMHGLCATCARRVEWYKDSDLRLLLGLLTAEQLETVKCTVLNALATSDQARHRETIMALSGSATDAIGKLPHEIRATMASRACRVLQGGPELEHERGA